MSDSRPPAEPPTPPTSGANKRWEPPSPEELQALMPGYTIEKLLGKGGMGAVYKGVQENLDRAVAIKIISNDLDEADASYGERFKNEAKAMAKLSHPGIVAVFDYGQTTNGILYIVMEYIEGTDVSRMIAQQKRLHTEHAMAITAHVCDALAYAHERGIIHRDIKPANIMVGYDGVVKVADFGLAKMTKSGESGLTQSGMAMGTLHYMAPEALMLGTAVDHRADIYAVGVMLYQMLIGKVPHGMFELPSTQVPGLDPRYDAIIAKAMREDRDIRYQSASELRGDLDHILTQPVVKVEADATQAPAALPTEARPHRPAGQPYRPPQLQAVAKPKKKSSPLVWILFLALGAGAAWMYWKPTEHREAPASASVPSSTEAWTRMLDKPEDHSTPSAVTEIKDGWITKKQSAASSSYVFGPTMQDGAVKAEFRRPANADCMLCLRTTTGGSAARYKLKRAATALQLSVERGGKNVIVKEATVPAYREQETYTLELRAVGRVFTCKLDGKEVMQFEDETAVAGRAQIALGQDGAVVRNVEVLNLDVATASTLTKPVAATPPTPAPSATSIKIDDAFMKANVLGTSWRTHYTNDSRYDTLEFKSTGNEVVKKASVGGQQQAVWSIEEGGNALKVTTLDSSGFYFLINFTSNNTADIQFIKVKTLSMVGIISKIAIPRSVSAAPVTNGTVISATKDQPFINSLGMKFVPVPGTNILMCIHETRKKDYAKYADANPGVPDFWKATTFENGRVVSETDEHPVVNVSWNDATVFCQWLSKKEGATCRLPTDREWSFAVGIGSREKADASPADLSEGLPDVFPWGSQWPPPQGAGNFADSFITGYADGYAATSPVMSFKPNGLGIYDLEGNVREWCENWYDAKQNDRTTRGATFEARTRNLYLASWRSHNAPGFHRYGTGFRCVIELASRSPQISESRPSAPTTWMDTKGRNLVAKFKGIQGDNVLLEIAGKVQPVPMSTLSEASQKQARDYQANAVPSLHQ